VARKQPDDILREHLAAILDWKDAHVDFDSVVGGIPREARGARPHGLPYSPWQLLEHMRITQNDILDFCLNADYEELKWPDEYWPETTTPPDDAAWEDSVRSYREDREALRRLAADPAVDLTSNIPHGNGQTYLRELLLVADHTAYHLGELVVVRRLLGIWP
jgi:hypothetical protein